MNIYSNPRKRFLAAIPIPGFLVFLITLLFVMPEHRAQTWAFDPPWLLLPVNTIFLGLIPLLVAFIALRTYLSTGLITILFMGCGVLALGSFNLVAGWVIGRPEGTHYTATIENLGVLIASIFHLGSAITTVMEDPSVIEPKRRIWWLILGYCGMPILLAFITLLTLAGMTPAFFIEGVGPTPLRQLVLGMAIGFFSASFLLFLRFYLRQKSEFLYWYSLALGLLAIGLLIVFFQKVVGGPIGWVGRGAQYLGAIYFIFAVLAAMRSAREENIPFQIALAGFFRKAEIHFRNLVETLGDAVISIDRNGRVLLWNDVAEKAFGYSRKESVGAQLADLNIFNHLAAVLGPAMKPLEGTGGRLQPSKFLMEDTGRRKDGSEFPVEISASVRDRERDATTFIVRDITERKRADEALRKSEAKLRAVFQSLAEGVVFLNTRGDVEEANEAVKHVHGHTLQELTDPELDPRWKILRPDGKLFPVEEQPAIVALRTGKAVRDVEMGVPTSDGGLRWRLVNAQPVHDDDGHLLGTVASFFDITDRKQAEEEIQKLNKELMKRARFLEMANQELDAFASMVSHDLKSQLLIIDGFIRRLIKQQIEKLDEKGQEYLGIVKESVGKMVTLVDDLLELSRVSKGPIRVEKVDLSEMAGSIMNKYQQMDAGRQIQLMIEKGMEAEGDPVLLEVGLDNLLGNAWKFTKHSHPARIEFGVSTETERPVFHIRDNGCGFTMPEDPEKVFLPFQRFHSTDEYLGSGVGLATVKRILERHGGMIWVESEIGKGTTFYFSLGQNFK